MRACEVTNNLYAMAAGRGNVSIMSVVETRFSRNTAIWFGSARPSKVWRQ